MLFSSNKVLGLDIGSTSIKIAELEGGPGGYKINRFTICPVHPEAISGGEIADPMGLAAALQGGLKAGKFKRKFAASAMWGSNVVVKRVSMPQMDAKMVADSIRWEAEQYIPFDINEVVIDHAILKKMGTAETMELLLVAAKQDHVFRVIEVVEASGLRASVLDVSAFALANCFEANYGVVAGTVGVLNVGNSVTNFVAIHNGEVVFSRDIPTGGGMITQEISRNMGVSIGEAESLKLSAIYGQDVPQEVNSILQNTVDSMSEEIKGSFDFFGTTSQGLALSRFYATGGSAAIKGLLEKVSQESRIGYEIMDPLRKISYNKRFVTNEMVAQLKSFGAISLGLGMRRVGDS